MNSAIENAADRGRLMPPKSRSGPWLAGALAVAIAVLLGYVGWAWWQARNAAPPAPPPAAVAEPPAVPPAAPASMAAATPVLETPVPEPKAVEAPLAKESVGESLTRLFGAKPERSLLLADDFVPHFVATVDNLGRAHAPSIVWPVQPTPGRFAVIERDGQLFADPDNGLRYTPFVLMVEKLDPHAAVALYVRLLPLMQQAYADLGFPNRRFHARLMAVIDDLLAAPQVPDLVPLTLTEVKGSVLSVRPWVRYEFADPALQSASAGQKIMMRVGAVNERRLKAKLQQLRAELVKQAQP
jgi:hypothetical protein